MASFTDNFNRTAATLGASWTKVSDGDIATNGTRAVFPAGDGAHWIYGTALDSDDHYCEAKIYAPSGNQQYVTVRGNGSNTFYYGGYSQSAGQYRIIKNVAGSLSVLATADAADPNGSLVRFQVEADALELFVDGVSTLTTTDSAIASGKRVGLYSNFDGREVDDWAAADIGGGGGGFQAAWASRANVFHGVLSNA